MFVSVLITTMITGIVFTSFEVCGMSEWAFTFICGIVVDLLVLETLVSAVKAYLKKEF